MNGIIISILLGIVEGITEFLPISSTGHLIILNNFLGFTGKFAKTYDIVIQFGAILAVVVYFRKKIFPFHKKPEEKKAVWVLWKKIIVATIPIIIIGAAFGSYLQAKLFNPIVVGAALLVGGIILLWVERKKKSARISSMSALSYQTALLIGLIQCLSMIPGTSRSAATIIGAMLFGCSRLIAAEFSFYLAIPTMAAASGYSLLKTGFMLSSSEIMLLSIGFIVSFLVAWAVIAWFISYISKRDFRAFGYYRIALGLVVLGYFGAKLFLNFL